MTADPIVVITVVLGYLRRVTLLGPVDADDLWPVVELVDRILRLLGVEAAAHPAAGLMLSAVAAAPNARRGGHWRCQHGTGVGACDLCPAACQDQVPPPAWTRRPARRRARYAVVRHDSRRPAGRLR